MNLKSIFILIYVWSKSEGQFLGSMNYQYGSQNYYNDYSGGMEYEQTLIEQCWDLGPPEPISIRLNGINGVTASIEMAPFMLSLWGPNGYVCAASLIHPKFGLSTNQCISKYPVEDMYIRAGTQMNTRGGQTAEIYRALFLLDMHDIGLLQFQTELGIGPRIKPIPLARTPLEPGAPARFFKWDQHHHFQPGRLRVLQQTIWDMEDCRLSRRIYIDNGFICAADDENDDCTYDEGAPIMVNGKQVGIASQDYSCGTPNAYVSVAHFYDWIQLELQGQLEPPVG